VIYKDAIFITRKELFSSVEVEIWTVKKEELEDTKGVIRIRISKKNRQNSGQKKKYKRTNNNLQNIHIKQKIE
jgi:hypothetical protein